MIEYVSFKVPTNRGTDSYSYKENKKHAIKQLIDDVLDLGIVLQQQMIHTHYDQERMIEVITLGMSEEDSHLVKLTLFSKYKIIELGIDFTSLPNTHVVD